MDLELFPLLVGIAIGGLLGRKGKDIVKPIAKGAMTLQEKAREWGANLREDMRDAIEEARYEREQESLIREEEPPAKPAPVPPAPRRRRSRAAAAASEEAPEKPKRTRRSRGTASTTGTTRRRRTSRPAEAAEGPRPEEAPGG